MALRTRSATSGPGRAPASDGRLRDGRGMHSTRRARSIRRAEALRRTGTEACRGDGPRDGEALGSAGPGPEPWLGGRAAPGGRPGRTPRLRGRAGLPSAPAAAVRRRADAMFGADPPPRLGGVAHSWSASPASAAATRAEEEQAEPETSARQRAALALRERLPLWVRLRCGLEPRALAALAVVLVVAAAFAVRHFWTGEPQTVHAPELVRQGTAAAVANPSPGPDQDSPAGAGTPDDPRIAPGTAQSAAGPAATIVIDVSGKVRRPGIQRLPAGSRVVDALKAAGGAKPGTDLTGLNQARPLLDGEQVLVGAPAPPAPAAGGGSGPGGARPAGPVSLNSASLEQLDTLPGVGPVLAQHIVDYRARHGGFRSVGELREVNGIGDRRFEDLQPLVRP
ncbi:ComEA family DNA-binding protein [Streptomyces sp. HNM0663]|uniref:ComEA family DNA-binding protein n=1 Tax=Streptomyces chengmaiensis TaxID=3040919 RepID=A0ABT6HRA8_9ACTN|nr:ComEA family DNA-binding protein [Streptomyces chengmaiensis]